MPDPPRAEGLGTLGTLGTQSRHPSPAVGALLTLTPWPTWSRALKLRGFLW